MRAQGGRMPGGAEAVSERPWSASLRNEGEVSVLEYTGRVDTNEGKRTTVSVSCISAARSRLEGYRQDGEMGGFGGEHWRQWLDTQWAGLPLGAPSQLGDLPLRRRRSRARALPRRGAL